MDKCELDPVLQKKLDDLKEYIKGLGSLAVGFSGGVDSTLLLSAAHDVLGDKALAVTMINAAIPNHEKKDAEEFCRERGIKHIVCAFNPLEIEEFRKNGSERCYYCKHAIFRGIQRTAAENGIEYVTEGSNMDDLGDYKPGLHAISELGVKAPLREVGLYKKEIREISKALGLPTWSKPAYACLATRFAVGEELTEERLYMADQAEQFLIDNGFAAERVRIHGDLARIEVPAEDVERLAADDMREGVYKKFKDIGFRYVTLDMHGYVQGSMNEALE